MTLDGGDVVSSLTKRADTLKAIECFTLAFDLRPVFSVGTYLHGRQIMSVSWHEYDSVHDCSFCAASDRYATCIPCNVKFFCAHYNAQNPKLSLWVLLSAETRGFDSYRICSGCHDFSCVKIAGNLFESCPPITKARHKA